MIVFTYLYLLLYLYTEYSDCLLLPFSLSLSIYYFFEFFLPLHYIVKRRLSHGDDTPKAVYREFWRFDAKRTAKEAKIERHRGISAKKSSSKKNGLGKNGSGRSKGSSGNLNNRHLSSAFILQQKRMNAVSKKVTTTPNQGHPNVDSQAFNNWIRLHFGAGVPEAQPLHKR
jgi:hypothetical protein